MVNKKQEPMCGHIKSTMGIMKWSHHEFLLALDRCNKKNPILRLDLRSKSKIHHEPNYLDWLKTHLVANQK